MMDTLVVARSILVESNGHQDEREDQEDEKKVREARHCCQLMETKDLDSLYWENLICILPAEY